MLAIIRFTFLVLAVLRIYVCAILHAFLQCMNAHCIYCQDCQWTVDHCQSIYSISSLPYSTERVQLAKVTYIFNRLAV